MGDYTVLAEAGESLINVLWEEIQIDPQISSLIDNENRISLDSPFDLQDNDSVKLSIYLYRITENASTKNQFPVQGNGVQLRKPPLTLDLHYLVTPLVGTVTDQQIILGKVMQVFYDRAILQGTDLTGSLAASGQEVRLILNPVALEETTRVWQAMEMSYRLSLVYLARVAMVDSRREQFVQPVVNRRDQFSQRPI
jgi:Pvc16 N-terminal domain